MFSIAHAALQSEQQDVIRHLHEGNGDQALPDELVAAMSGDREFTSDQRTEAEGLWRERGKALFSQLLFAVTHQYFPPEEAEAKWCCILRHKYELSERLGRNVGIAVAALDYLANLRHDIESPVIISRPSMDAIVRMAVEDPLTHVANRSAVLARLDDEIHRCSRHGTPCSMLLLDIDDFSRINDTLGHDSGDEAIREFATALIRALREVDVCGRFGGDEFMVLLPDTAAAEAGRVAERIVGRLREVATSRTKLACSIGVASCPEHGWTTTDILSAADRALLEAKRRGKDRVVTFERIAQPSVSEPKPAAAGDGAFRAMPAPVAPLVAVAAPA
jgi:diguanylate cyclase (GGDEF)-like protein